MKLVALTVAGSLALALSAGAFAAHEPKRHKAKAKTAHHRVQHKVTRPGASYAGGCGLRNHGTPISELDFKNPCDQEEFWLRMQERGGESR